MNTNTEILTESKTEIEKQHEIRRLVPSTLIMNEPLIHKKAVKDKTPDIFPIPSHDNREGYGGKNDALYVDYGLHDYYHVSEFIAIPKAPKILDIGGCTGRVLRHFANHDPAGTYFISEMNKKYVAWVNTNLDLSSRGGPKIGAVQAQTNGILPFEDNYFDIIMGFSVFTHIDYNIETIQNEIFRVLKPGGKIWFSFHSEFTWMTRHDLLLDHALRSYPGYPEKAENWEINGFISFRKVENDPYMCQVFETCDHALVSWRRLFCDVSVIANGYGTHDVIIGNKSTSTPWQRLKKYFWK
jgi:ubiquinone/menaquinone biosynthesis C-methylase UbiE